MWKKSLVEWWAGADKQEKKSLKTKLNWNWTSATEKFWMLRQGEGNHGELAQSEKEKRKKREFVYSFTQMCTIQIQSNIEQKKIDAYVELERSHNWMSANYLLIMFKKSGWISKQ